MTNKKNKPTLLLFMLCLLFAACSDQPKSRSETLAWFGSEKSNFTTNRKLQDVNFTCRLKPPVELALLGSGKTSRSQKEFETELSQYEKEFQLVFTIKDHERSSSVKKMVYDEKTYGSLIAFANTEMSEDFTLRTSSGKVVPCAFVHLEPGNAVSPAMRFTVGFHYSRPAGEDLVVVFNDRIFNNGPIRFNYDHETLDYLPKLKFNS